MLEKTLSTTTGLLPRPEPQRGQELREFLASPEAGPLLDEALNILKRHEVIRVEPGKLVEIYDLPGYKPQSRFTRREDGTIEAVSSKRIPHIRPADTRNRRSSRVQVRSAKAGK